MTMRSALRALRDQPFVRERLVTFFGFLKRAGIPIGSTIYRHIPYVGVVTVDLPSGGSFRMHSQGGAVENGLYWEGLSAHEPASMRNWIRNAAHAGCVLDIGANAGIFALAAAAAGAAAVHAFEPLPRVHALLAANVRLNAFQGLRAWPLAVGSSAGMATLYDPSVDASAPTSASLSAEFTKRHFGDMPGTPVEVVTIDEFCERGQLPRICLVKLDVEGYEDHALRGMQATLRRDKPIVLMEVLPEYEAKLRATVFEVLGEDYEWIPIHEGSSEPDRNVWLRPKVSNADS